MTIRIFGKTLLSVGSFLVLNYWNFQRKKKPWTIGIFGKKTVDYRKLSGFKLSEFSEPKQLTIGIFGKKAVDYRKFSGNAVDYRNFQKKKTVDDRGFQKKTITNREFSRKNR